MCPDIIMALKPWEERKTRRICNCSAILARANQAFAEVPEAVTFAFGLPPITGLSIHRGISSSCWRIAAAANCSSSARWPIR